MVKERLLKTVIYRVTALIITQILMWILVHDFVINGLMLIGEIIRFIFYYLYELVWDKKTKKFNN